MKPREAADPMKDLREERERAETVCGCTDLAEEIPRGWITEVRRKPRDVGKILDDYADVMDVAATPRTVNFGLRGPEVLYCADHVDQGCFLTHRLSSGQSSCRVAFSIQSSIRSQSDFAFSWALRFRLGRGSSVERPTDIILPREVVRSEIGYHWEQNAP